MHQWIISWSDCDFWQKWILHDSQLRVRPRRSSKALPNPNLDQKRSWSLWWSVACLIHNSFLNPGKTITSEKYAQQNDEMHWKLQCLQLALVNRKGPILRDSTWMLSYNQHFKNWMNWAMKFCLICHIHLTSCQPTITYSSISKTFCRENASITSRMQKMLSKSSSNPEAEIFYAIEINLFFHWQKCVDCNGHILVNKDVFEPGYELDTTKRLNNSKIMI